MITIYALVDPNTGMPRYVGQTNRTVERRLGQHLSASRKATKPHVNAWLRSLSVSNLKPEIWIMEECHSNEGGHEAEVFWIGMLRAWGFDLVNILVGGKQHRGWRHTADAKSKMSATRRGRPTEWLQTKEVKSKIGKKIKVHWENNAHPMLGRRGSNNPNFGKSAKPEDVAKRVSSLKERYAQKRDDFLQQIGQGSLL
jgi:hypothetical protein